MYQFDDRNTPETPKFDLDKVVDELLADLEVFAGD